MPEADQKEAYAISTLPVCGAIGVGIPPPLPRQDLNQLSGLSLQVDLVPNGSVPLATEPGWGS